MTSFSWLPLHYHMHAMTQPSQPSSSLFIAPHHPMRGRRSLDLPHSLSIPTRMTVSRPRALTDHSRGDERLSTSRTQVGRWSIDLPHSLFQTATPLLETNLYVFSVSEGATLMIAAAALGPLPSLRDRFHLHAESRSSPLSKPSVPPVLTMQSTTFSQS